MVKFNLNTFQDKYVSHKIEMDIIRRSRYCRGKLVTAVETLVTTLAKENEVRSEKRGVFNHILPKLLPLLYGNYIGSQRALCTRPSPLKL